MKPMLASYRYGTKRQPDEGLRIGAARLIPRGVPRADWQRRHYFDLWLPLVAPTADLVSDYRHGKISFAVFSRRYKSQMKRVESRQVIELLAGVALFQPISIGCFCEDASRCHRSILHELIRREANHKAAEFSHLQEGSSLEESVRFASPVCFAHTRE